MVEEVGTGNIVGENLKVMFFRVRLLPGLCHNVTCLHCEARWTGRCSCLFTSSLRKAMVDKHPCTHFKPHVNLEQVYLAASYFECLLI